MSAQTAGKQLSLAEACESAPEPEPTIEDDRVVEDANECDCGRPAGADGLCTACRMDHNGRVGGGRAL